MRALCSIFLLHIGVSPSGKATDFDSVIRWFKSSHPSHVGAKYALLRFSFWKKIIRPLPCSSFFAKGHAWLACSVASALTTARGRYQLFAAAPAGADLFVSPSHVGMDYAPFKIPGHSTGVSNTARVIPPPPKKSRCAFSVCLQARSRRSGLLPTFCGLRIAALEILFSYPHRSKLGIACSDFLKIRARSRVCRSATNFAHSLSTKTTPGYGYVLVNGGITPALRQKLVAGYTTE